MDLQRNFLIITLMFISLIIWQIWKQDKNMLSQKDKIQMTNDMNVNSYHQNRIISDNCGKKIKIKTDVLELIVNTLGGDVEQAVLLNYKERLKSNKPFQLLKTTPGFIYQAQNGLIGRDGPDNPINGSRPLYQVDKDIFLLDKNQNELVVPMIWVDQRKNVFTKKFILKRGEYAIDVNFTIQNRDTRSLEISTFGQLKQSINMPSDNNLNSGNFVLHTFRGAAYSTINDKYEKYKFDNIINNNHLNIISKRGWVAMLQQYFASAWIPRGDNINNFYTNNIDNSIAIIGYKSNPILIHPGKNGQLRSTLWIGPEIQNKMANVAPYLDLTVDYGWLWFISQPLFRILKFINSFFKNWGFSIITITFIVRIIMYPLTKAQYVSIAKMRMLQPKIQEIRKRLYNSKQRQSQEIIALYKAENVNPLGGCFPLLVQMPIFLALYYMLIGSVELRHASFILWIHDLSAQDPYYILPILMGITMLLIHKMSPPSNITDHIQGKIMTLMPIIFTMFFLWFPSGLVLYYTVSNLVTIIQQYLISHSLEKGGLHKEV